MGIPLNRVRPFFQVVVFHIPADSQIDLRQYLRAITTATRRRDSTFQLLHSEVSGKLQYSHVKHSTDPSWVTGDSRFRNVEHDEVIIYRNGEFGFVHSNCRALLDLLTEELKEQFDCASASSIENVLVRRKAEIRALGMQNLNAPGKTSPEGKIHFARNAALTLSPVRDSMFGFRHAFAVEPGISGAKPRPFGCSTKQRKVWGTWVDDAAAFVTECDRVSLDLRARDTGHREWVLAAPVARPPNDLETIAIYADYFIERRGLLWMEHDDGTFSSDWTCYFVDPDVARFEITNTTGDVAVTDLTLQRETHGLKLVYTGADSRRVKVADSRGELLHKRIRDLADVLNSEEAFTVVYTQALSYRAGGFWRNKGLDETFRRTRTEIDWTGIDITAESLAPNRTDTIGDAIIHYLVAQGWPKVVICDDRANEIADYVVVGDNKLVLIHAKFSESQNVGLRVDDLQVVLAQCLKNLQYFQLTAVEPFLERLAQGIRPEFTAGAAAMALVEAAYRNQRIERECWIVQPGISARRLRNSRRNKIHALLNHVETACLPSNVNFNLFCSA